MIGGLGGERPVERLHPEHAAGGHPAGAAVGETARASGRRTSGCRRGASEKVIVQRRRRRVERVGERSREGGPVLRCHARSLPTGANCGVLAADPPRRAGRRGTHRRRRWSTTSTLAPDDWSASTPIAVSTGDGSSDSLEHDDPECTATPRWSSEEDRLRLDPLDAEADEIRQARRGIAVALDAVDPPQRTRGERGAERRRAAPHARARRHRSPRTPRRSRRWQGRSRCPRVVLVPVHRPPRTAEAEPSPHEQGCGTLGPPNVCPVTEHRSALSAASKSTGTWPAAADASTWTTAPAPSPARRVPGPSSTGCRRRPRGWRAAPRRARCRGGRTWRPYGRWVHRDGRLPRR